MVTLLVHTRDPRRLRRELGARRTCVLLWALGGPPLLGLTLPIGLVLLAVWALATPSWESAAYSGITYYLGMATIVFGGFLIIYVGLAMATARREGESALPTLIIPVYWLAMSAATYAAAFEFLRRPHHWYRTEHGYIGSYGDPAPNGAGSSGQPPLPGLAPAPDHGSGMSIRGNPAVGRAGDQRRAGSATWRLIVLPALAIGVVDFAFGQWLRSHGMEWGDAMSRQMNAVLVFYGSDPHLAALGFVWPPLPAFLDLLPAIFYPIWPGVISSGIGAGLVTSLAGAGTAGVLLWTGQKLRVRATTTLALVALVCLNPLIFIYAGSGMSEAVAAPFLIGSMCCTTLFLRLRQDRYLVAAGLTLALGLASVYEAAAYGAALAFGLALVLWRSRDFLGTRAQRTRMVNLALAFVIPSVFVAIAWMAANLIIMGDAFYFAHSSYSARGQILDVRVPGSPALSVAHHLAGTIGFIAERTLPLLIPLAGILTARVMGHRFRRTETVLPVLVCLSVPILLLGPLVYLHLSLGFFRYFIYVLFGAAGWSLYELASPNRRRAATAIVLVGWALAVPATAVLMSRPRVGLRQDNVVIKMVEHPGRGALGLGLYGPPIADADQTADYLAARVLPFGRVLADASTAWPIAAQVSPYELGHHLILNADTHFASYLRDPTRFGIKYLVVANPHFWLRDAIDKAYPRAYWGSDPRFRIVRRFGGLFGFRVLAVKRVASMAVAQRGGGRL